MLRCLKDFTERHLRTHRKLPEQLSMGDQQDVQQMSPAGNTSHAARQLYEHVQFSEQQKEEQKQSALQQCRPVFGALTFSLLASIFAVLASSCHGGTFWTYQGASMRTCSGLRREREQMRIPCSRPLHALNT